VDLATLLAALSGGLPATVSELDELLGQVTAQIHVYQARAAANEQFTPEQVTELNELLAGHAKVKGARDEAAAAENTHNAGLSEALARAAELTGGEPAPAETPADPEAAAEVVAEAEAVVEAAAETEPVTAGARPINFVEPGTGSGADTAPTTPEGPGWVMRPDAPGFQPGRVGFSVLARGLDGVTKGSRRARSAAAKPSGSYFAQTIAELPRDVPMINDSHELVAEIERVTRTVPEYRGSSTRVPLSTTALVAAGGWCAPSEQLYDFCDVPDPTDLVSVPEITINRGGVRWPVEPDLTTIYKNFQFFFTEPELEALDNNGNPTAVKQCVEIPCPDEFEEMRLNAVGYCVEAGILQTQGWPELITWFMQSLAAEHLRAISRRTILDMVSGSDLKTISGSTTIGSVGRR